MDTSITSFKFYGSVDKLLTEDMRSQLQLLEKFNLTDLKVCIDKCWIRTNYFSVNKLKSEFTKKNPRGSRYYEERQLLIHKENKFLVIQIFKNSRSLKSRYKHKIELNPSHFKNFSEMKSILNKLLGKKGLRKNRTARLDISFKFPDSQMTVDALYYSTYLKGKHISGQYRNSDQELEDKPGRDPHVSLRSGFLDTIHIGQFPLRLTIYNQKLKPKNPQSFINLELQFSREKVQQLLKIGKVQDLPSLIKIDPLELLSFKDVTKIKKNMLPRNGSVPKKLAIAFIKTHSLGLHTARSFCIKHGNPHFDDNIMKRLQELDHADNGLPLKKNLLNKYRHDLQRYFDS